MPAACSRDFRQYTGPLLVFVYHATLLESDQRTPEVFTAELRKILTEKRASSLLATDKENALMQGPIPPSWAPYVRSVLRIVAAFLFTAHGTQKLFAYPVLEPSSPVPLASLPGLAGVLELVGGALLLVGLFTRPVAFLLSGQMAVAYFMAHAPRGFWPTLNGGEPAVLFCFVWLYFAAAGAGPWSLDARRGGS